MDAGLCVSPGVSDFTATFFSSLAGFFSEREALGFGELFGVAVFFGVARGVGFGVAFGESFGVGRGVLVGRGVELGVGVGAGVSSSAGVGLGGGVGMINASSIGGKGGSGVGVAAGASSSLADCGAFIEIGDAAGPAELASIHTMLLESGFFAVALQRSRPVRTRTWAAPTIARLRQKFPWCGMA